MNDEFYEIEELLDCFEEQEKDKYIKRQAELGLKSPKKMDRSMWSDDEFEAWYYIMRDKPVPEELKEKILCVQHWEIPLYQILFDVYDEMQLREAKRERFERDEYGQEIYIKGSELHHWYFTSMRSRNYLKMQSSERERLKQLQERFLKIFDIYFTNFSMQLENTFQEEIKLHSVKVPVTICNKMEKQKVSFQGYITLDDVETFIQREEQELPMEHKMVVTLEDLKENKELIVQIANKLVKENVIKEKSSSFLKVLEILEFIPATNLRKILEVNCDGCNTFSKWMQEMKKRELLEFFPYIYERKNCFNPKFILSYDEILKVHSIDSVTIEYGSPDGLVYGWGSMFEEYEKYKKYDEEYHKSYERKSEKFEEYSSYVDIKGSDFGRDLDEEEIDQSVLSQVLFYMWVMNTGNISQKFQLMLREKKGKELFDYFVRISAESEGFSTFNVTFDDLNQYISKQFYLFWDCSEFCILEKEKEVGDIKEKDCFRVPAIDSDYDLCRVVVYSSLKIVIEQDSGQRELITLNLEPLLEQIPSLQEKEKQDILNNIDIKMLVVIFGLNLANVSISNRNVYAMKSLSVMRKWEKGLPEVCNLNDLYDIL